MIKNSFVVGAAVAAAFVSANTAFAGGLSEEVVEPIIVVPVAPTIANRFAGAYVGGALSYVVSSDDRVGISEVATGDHLGTVGNLQLEGFGLSLFGGYRWTNDKVVYGPELRLRAGDISDTSGAAAFPISGIARSNASNELKWEGALRGTVGYLVQPETLLYGFVGYAFGKFDYQVAGAMNFDDTISMNGYDVGFGVEHAFNDAWSVRAEYEYIDYGKKQLIGTGGARYTYATPETHNLSLGLVYSF